MAMNGSLFVVLVNTGTPEVPAYEVVGYQRDATVEESTATIDVSSKNERAARVLPGRYSGTVSFDALFVPTDAAYQALLNALRNGDLVQLAVQENDVVTETVNANVDSLSRSYPDQDAATVSASFTLDGMWEAAGS